MSIPVFINRKKTIIDFDLHSFLLMIILFDKGVNLRPYYYNN